MKQNHVRSKNIAKSQVEDVVFERERNICKQSQNDESMLDQKFIL